MQSETEVIEDKTAQPILPVAPVVQPVPAQPIRPVLLAEASRFIMNSDIFVLPSAGIPYDPERVPLLPGGAVRVRRITGGDIKQIAGGNTENTYLFYQTILSHLVVEPRGIDFGELLFSDVLGIMMAITNCHKGDAFEQPLKCTEKEACGFVGVVTLKMSEALTVRMCEPGDSFQTDGIEIEIDDVDLKAHKLSMHLPRLRDEKAVYAMTKAHMKDSGKNKIGPIEGMFIRIASYIDVLDGAKQHIEARIRLLERCDMETVAELSRVLSEMDRGIILDLDVECPHCGEPQKARLEPTATFFRPDRRLSKGHVRIAD